MVYYAALKVYSLIMNENPIEPSDIIDYWFSEKSKQFWFASTPSIDKEITSRYETVWEKAASGGLSSWGETADGSVALIIILDQFPLNMFRGKAKGFKTESMAVEVALNAIDNGFDEEMDNEKLLFLFMPLMHSENLDHQNLKFIFLKSTTLTLSFQSTTEILLKSLVASRIEMKY